MTSINIDQYIFSVGLDQYKEFTGGKRRLVIRYQKDKDQYCEPTSSFVLV